MISRRALIDSNVIIAALDADHPHHEPSAVLLGQAPLKLLAVAAHSYAETFTTLTRLNAASPYKWPPARAVASLRSVAGSAELVGMTPAQTLDAVLRYGDNGGMGTRIYDYLIGQAAVHAGLQIVVTWNLAHLRPLFPRIEVIDPVQALA